MENERYIWCIFLGHGSIINHDDIVDYVHLRDLNVSVTTCQIAAPTSTCVMMPETLIKIKDWLIKNENHIEDNRVNELFQQSIMSAQIENLKCLYRSKDWAECGERRFNIMPKHTEKYLYDLNRNDQLPDKFFTSSEEELYGQSGVHIIKNNVGLDNGSSYLFPMTLEGFISHFTANYGVNKFYLVDFTCSVLEENVSERTRRYVARDIIKKQITGGTRKINHRRRRMRKTKMKKNRTRKSKIKMRKIEM
jgi:hypothetical protein